MKLVRIPHICLLLALLIAGCDLTDDDDEDFDAVAGTWSADTFTLTVDDETHDILEGDGELSMTLNEDGSVDDGLLRAPCSIPGTCDEDEEADFFEAEFEGTFAIDGQTVTFNHAANTFIRDVAWIYDGSTLSTSTTAITVVMRR